MANPKHTDTSRSGDLVANMRDTIREWERDEPRDDWFLHQHDFAEAADRIEALITENERLREAIWDAVAEIEMGRPMTASHILAVAYDPTALGETK